MPKQVLNPDAYSRFCGSIHLEDGGRKNFDNQLTITMKNSVLKITALIGSMLLAISCAEEYPSPTDGVARESFDRWMKNNVPGAVPVGDIYIEFVDTTARATLDSIVIPTLRQTYLLMDYTGRTLDGTMFTTRSSAVARLIGSWAVTTHYCDDYVLMENGSSVISQGFYQGLLQMRQGDSVRIYMPGELGYKVDFGYTNAYLNGSVQYKNFPVIMDVRLKNIVKFPEAFELKNLQEFAFKEWEQESRDTVYPGIYMRKLNYNYDGYKIGADSSVYVDYAEYYLGSDFLIRSNIDSLVKAHPEHSTTTSENNRVPIKLDVGTTSYGEVFRQGLMKMRKGETAEFLVLAKNTSDGIQGNPSGKPEILPYQSKRFVIKAFTQQEYDARNKKK